MPAYKKTQILLGREDVYLAFFVVQLANVYEGRAHRAIVWLDFLSGVLFCGNVCGDDPSFSSLSGLRDTCQQLLLSLEGLVSLTFPELLETVANDNFVQGAQLSLKK